MRIFNILLAVSLAFTSGTVAQPVPLPLIDSLPVTTSSTLAVRDANPGGWVGLLPSGYKLIKNLVTKKKQPAKTPPAKKPADDDPYDMAGIANLPKSTSTKIGVPEGGSRIKLKKTFKPTLSTIQEVEKKKKGLFQW